MKIGWIVEGSTDKAFVQGLRDRWCPSAKLEKIGFRGTQFKKTGYSKACAEARLRGCDLVVILTDSNNASFRNVHQNELRQLDAASEHNTVIGVAERNIECWICADRDFVAQICGCAPAVFDTTDPKTRFEQALGITTFEKREDKIAKMICDYPCLKKMLAMPSFAHFYETVRDFAQQNGCNMPNERDR